jgi:hypothetical protein
MLSFGLILLLISHVFLLASICVSAAVSNLVLRVIALLYLCGPNRVKKEGH